MLEYKLVVRHEITFNINNAASIFTYYSFTDCLFQMTIPGNAQAWFNIYDLRGRFTDSSATGCPYKLYIFNGGNSYKEWCTRNVWYREPWASFYVGLSADGNSQQIDIVFQDSGPSAQGALWIFVQSMTFYY